MKRRILGINILMLVFFCALSCHPSGKNNMELVDEKVGTKGAEYQFAKLVYDNDRDLLIIQNNESARIVSEIQLNTKNDTL